MSINVINQALVSIVVGEDGSITHEVKDRETPLDLSDHHVYHDHRWISIRQERDALLKETDWVVMRAMERGTVVPPGWLLYRQGLRDITQQRNPFFIEWPTKPASAPVAGAEVTVYPPEETL